MNPGVDRLPRDVTPRIAGKIIPRASSDLVGRPPLPQPLTHVTGDLGPLHFAGPGPMAATRIRLDLGRRRPVAVGVAVAPQLTGNRRRMPFQPPGNFRLAATGMDHLGYPLAFLKSKMTCHHGDSVQQGYFRKPPYRTSP